MRKVIIEMDEMYPFFQIYEPMGLEHEVTMAMEEATYQELKELERKFREYQARLRSLYELHRTGASPEL